MVGFGVTLSPRRTRFAMNNPRTCHKMGPGERAVAPHPWCATDDKDVTHFPNDLFYGYSVTTFSMYYRRVENLDFWSSGRGPIRGGRGRKFSLLFPKSCLDLVAGLTHCDFHANEIFRRVSHGQDSFRSRASNAWREESCLSRVRTPGAPLRRRTNVGLKLCNLKHGQEFLKMFFRTGRTRFERFKISWTVIIHDLWWYLWLRRCGKPKRDRHTRRANLGPWLTHQDTTDVWAFIG
jgi:hypothetical protein